MFLRDLVSLEQDRKGKAKLIQPNSNKPSHPIICQKFMQLNSVVDNCLELMFNFRPKG